MNEAILTAAIGAIATLIGTAAYLLVELRKERRQRVNDAEALDDALAATSSSLLYPYVAEEFRVDVSIPDTHGTSTTTKQTIGVRAAAGTAVHAFYGDVFTVGELKEPPRLISQSRADIELVGDFQNEHTYAYQVRFPNGLTPDDAPCSFAIRWSASGSVCVDSDAIRVRYGDRGFDYHSEVVNTPVGRFELTVRWPEPGDYAAYPSVTFGTLEMVSTRERARIEKGFTITPDAATLRVIDPKVGMRYMIAWRGRNPGRPRQTSN